MNAALVKARNLYLDASGLARFVEPVALFFARLALARVFWRSGLGKVETFEVAGLRLPTWNIEQSTFFLFNQIHFQGLPKGLTDVLAVMATIGELTLPILVVFGLLTRFGAAGLLVMTAVIQFFVLPDAWWGSHAWWAACALVLIAIGPGALSLDRLLGLEKARS